MGEIIMRYRNLRELHLQVTLPISDMASTSPDPEGNDTIARFSIPNQGSHTADFSFALICSILFTSSSRTSLSHQQHYHHCRTQGSVIPHYVLLP